ncbi:MAG: hypothetical protein LQ337_004270, partial [Flavoplaca oasis]
MTAATKEPRRSKRVAELEDKRSRCNVESTPPRFAQSAVGVKVACARKRSHPVRNDTNINLGWQPTAQAKRRKELERSSSGITNKRIEREGTEFKRFAYI